jgi:hypothetical protein
MLGAAGALYTATGNKTYLTAGNFTLNALVTSTDFNKNGVLFESTCDATACTDNDNAVCTSLGSHILPLIAIFLVVVQGPLSGQRMIQWN